MLQVHLKKIKKRRASCPCPEGHRTVDLQGQAAAPLCRNRKERCRASVTDSTATEGYTATFGFDVK